MLELTPSELQLQRIQEIPSAERDLLLAIHAEMKRAEEKHPVFAKDIVHGAAVVAEEAGECVRAALINHYENGALAEVFTESIHTAATALRLMKSMMQ